MVAAHESQNRIILSVSSDIGASLALDWSAAGHNVWGTYRTWNAQCDSLKNAGVRLISCDLANQESLQKAVQDLAPAGKWDALVLAAGDIAPVEPFLDAPFSKWRHSVDLNFLSQMQFLHAMLPARNLTNKLKPVVLFFAGGGTNSAPVGSSAYTISKIALIKCCEMLDAEIPDTRFTILGPGWVKTKIHQPALDADATNPVHQKTMDMLKGGDFFSMERVIDCCNWLIGSPAELIGGRNFSAVHDQWGQKDLNEKLLKDPNMYKLRRAGNESAVKAKA